MLIPIPVVGLCAGIGSERREQIKGSHDMNNVVPYVIYADGACPNNGREGAVAGYGAIIRNPQGEFLELAGPVPKSDSQTNNRGELLAALYALRGLRNNSSVLLFSDSQLVIKGINEWLDGWKAKGWRKSDKKPVEHRDIWEEIDAHKQRLQLSARWIRGHNREPGNEHADRLAFQGAQGLTIERRTAEAEAQVSLAILSAHLAAVSGSYR